MVILKLQAAHKMNLLLVVHFPRPCMFQLGSLYRITIGDRNTKCEE